MQTDTIVTKCFDFCYGHYLPEYDGKCANMHGHNSRVEVSLRMPTEEVGDPANGYAGMVRDFADIKEDVNAVLAELDHTCLNLKAPFDVLPPTAENIAQYIFNHLEVAFGDLLYSVRLSETPTSWAEVRRES